jgi:hypothetical protein
VIRLAFILSAALLLASPAISQTTPPNKSASIPNAGRVNFDLALMMLGNYIAGWECLRKGKTLDESFLVMSMQDLGEQHFGMTRAETGAFIKAAVDQQLASQAKSGKCTDPLLMVLWPQLLADAFVELGKIQR